MLSVSHSTDNAFLGDECFPTSLQRHMVSLALSSIEVKWSAGAGAFSLYTSSYLNYQDIDQLNVKTVF
jgi:hypothetical protein